MSAEPRFDLAARCLHWITAAVLIAVIAAWALIAVADIIGRAIAKAATERAAGQTGAAKIASTATPVSATLPKALPARNLVGRDKGGFLAVATRVADSQQQLLLVKPGKAPVWVSQDEVDVDAS